MKTIGVVPARGGSKGLAHKNLRLVGGRTLVERAIASGQESGVIDDVVVTSEDDEILEVARFSGAMALRRPSQLASDTARTADAVLDACAQLKLEGCDLIVLLQPTSPLRTGEQIADCVRALLGGPFRSSVEMVEVDASMVLKTCVLADGELLPVRDWQLLESPRQLLPVCCKPSGGVYAISVETLSAEGRFIVPRVATTFVEPRTSIDIDSEADLETANLLVNNPAASFGRESRPRKSRDFSS